MPLTRKVGVMGKLENKTEKQLMVLRYFFRSKPIGGDCYADYCLLCGEEALEKLLIKHKKQCEVGKLLKKHT